MTTQRRQTIETMPVCLRVENLMVYDPGDSNTESPKSIVSRERSFSSTDLSGVSRNSSFSSFSSNTTGSSGCVFDTDSSVSPSNSFRDREGLDFSPADAIMPSEQPSTRRINTVRSRLRKLQTSLDGREHDETSRNRQGNLHQSHDHTTSPLRKIPAIDRRPFLAERSSSESGICETKSRLSSPEGLMILTPPAKSSYLSPKEPRLRSKSESYSAEHTPKFEEPKSVPKEETKTRKIDRRAVKSCCLDEREMKKCLLLLKSSSERKVRKAKDYRPLDRSTRVRLLQRTESSNQRTVELAKQVEQLIKERDEARRLQDEISHDRDRIKCERDALELERDILLRDNEDLQNELTNRSDVIKHLQEYLEMAPVPSPSFLTLDIPFLVTKDNPNKATRDSPAKTKPTFRSRSKSDVRQPEFYLPDHVPGKTNAYTCL